jgi:hypothetical protein
MGALSDPASTAVSPTQALKYGRCHLVGDGMTTSTAMFQTRSSRSALRAAAILGLCASLVAGFVAHASQAPASGAPDAIASAASHGRSA